MIISFQHKGLKLFFETGSTAGIQAKHSAKLNMLLTALDATETVQAMAVPSWNLHPLHGDLAGHWSVKVSGNWRLTFKFENGHAHVVNYQDYH
ncbi:type II toxin-antitoxin system RelE/ParE family toxin [Pasteurellaceae bacterium 22721_9_1]